MAGKQFAFFLNILFYCDFLFSFAGPSRCKLFFHVVSLEWGAMTTKKTMGTKMWKMAWQPEDNLLWVHLKIDLLHQEIIDTERWRVKGKGGTLSLLKTFAGVAVECVAMEMGVGACCSAPHRCTDTHTWTHPRPIQREGNPLGRFCPDSIEKERVLRKKVGRDVPALSTCVSMCVCVWPVSMEIFFSQCKSETTIYVIWLNYEQDNELRPNKILDLILISKTD